MTDDHYPDAEAHLADHLEGVLLLVKRHVARYGHRMLQSSGRLSDLHVSFQEASGVMDSGLTNLDDRPRVEISGWPTAEVVESEIRAHNLRTTQRLAQTARRGTATLPIEDLRAIHRLSDRQLALLMAAAAPALSVDLARLYAFAWADFAFKLPTVGFLAEMLAERPGRGAAWLRELRPDSILIQKRLVELRDSPTWGSPSPLIHRSVVVPESILTFLQGELGPLEDALARCCKLGRPGKAVPHGELSVSEGVREQVQKTLRRAARDRSGQPRLVLLGPRGSGRRSIVEGLLVELGLSLMTVDLDALRALPAPLEVSLSSALREASLRQCAVLLRVSDAIGESESQHHSEAQHLGAVLAAFDGIVVLTMGRSQGALHRALGTVVEIPFAPLNAKQRQAVWLQSAARFGAGLEPELAALMAHRFTLPPGAITRAVEEAQTTTGRGKPLETKVLESAIRRQLDHALSALAEPFASTLTWDDIVLPAETDETLQEILMHAHYRSAVYDDWGFRRKLSHGRGLACLFSGPPGTGKTTMAALMAKELGNDIYRVDLSRISSKWVGETEKNLARVFDEAERAQVILLFDEADSLFATRTRVESSNDRFANMEINYLLQRMESYDGITILTTNFEQGIDEAFKRRIKFRVHFPLPDASQRKLLWEAMLPSEAALAPNIDFEDLGARFEMSGGNIKNAVLRAAFYAVRESKAIGFTHLERAALAEAREMGMLIHSSKYDE